MKPCAQPIDHEMLAAWWLGELQDAGALEEHLLGCAHCARRAEALAACAQGIRAAVRDGRLALALTPRFLDQLRQEGLRIREYPAEPGARVDCTIRAEDDGVVGRLKAPLAGVARLDAFASTEVAGRIERQRLEDVPFDARSGEVLLAPSAAALRRMPAHAWRVRLVAVEDSGERSLGEYDFHHVPS